MSEWYWNDENERRGPGAGRELKELAVWWRVTPATLIWKKGQTEWVAAKTINSLFGSTDSPQQRPAGADEPPLLPRSGPVVSVNAGAAMESAMQHATRGE